MALRLAPTDHGAICEIELPAGAEAGHLLLEGVDEHSRIDASGAVFDGRVQAWVDSSPAQGYDRAEGATRMYVMAEVEPPPVSVQQAREEAPAAC